jgi:Mn2+/Fe2+ NRAMP family transporter
VGKKIAQIGLGVGVLIGAATVLAALGAPPLMVGTLIVAVTLVFAYMAYKLYSESVEQMKTSHGHVVGITSEKMADMATPNLRQNAPRMPPPRPLTQRQPVVIGQLTRVKIDPSELKSNQGTAATPKAGK